MNVVRQGWQVGDLVPDMNMPPPDEVAALWADEVQLVVRRLAAPSGLPEDVVGGVVTNWADVDVTAEEAAHYAKAVAWDDDRQMFHDYVFQERRTELSWGASSSGITWIVDLAASVSTEALTAGMLYAIHKIRGRFAGRDEPWPLTLDAARAKARQSLAVVYELDAQKLELTGDSRSSDGREIKVTFASDNGAVYWGRVSLLGGLYLTAEVGHSASQHT